MHRPPSNKHFINDHGFHEMPHNHGFDDTPIVPYTIPPDDTPTVPYTIPHSHEFNNTPTIPQNTPPAQITRSTQMRIKMMQATPTHSANPHVNKIIPILINQNIPIKTGIFIAQKFIECLILIDQQETQGKNNTERIEKYIIVLIRYIIQFHTNRNQIDLLINSLLKSSDYTKEFTTPFLRYYKQALE